MSPSSTTSRLRRSSCRSAARGIWMTTAARPGEMRIARTCSATRLSISAPSSRSSRPSGASARTTVAAGPRSNPLRVRLPCAASTVMQRRLSYVPLPRPMSRVASWAGSPAPLEEVVLAVAVVITLPPLPSPTTPTTIPTTPFLLPLLLPPPT